MEKHLFSARFEKAVQFCHTFTQPLVVEHLPDRVQIDFAAARGGTWPIHRDGRIKFLGGRLLHRHELVRLTATRAASLLWVAGKIPYWINLMVVTVDADATILEAAITNRLTDDDTALFHQHAGLPPFHILGPPGADYDQRMVLADQEAAQRYALHRCETSRP